MRSRIGIALTVLAALLWTAACVDVPGATEGEPCNSQGICATGLFCNEDQICRSTPTESVWEVMLTPDKSKIKAIWGRDDEEIYAVGEKGVYKYRGDGVNWDAVKHELTVGSFNAIWGDDTQVFAVGGNTILRHDGSTWTKEQLFDSTKVAPDDEIKDYFTLNAVRGDFKAVYAVGSHSNKGMLIKRHSGSWHTVEEADLPYIGNDLWLSGDKLTIVGQAKQVRVLDGSSWETQNLQEEIKLVAIWGSGDTLIAVGPAGMLLKFDGKLWQQLEDVRQDQLANAIWGDGDRYYIAGGYYSNSSIERCVNESCVAELLPEKARGSIKYGIWGTKTWLYAVGDSGMILRRKR